MNYIEFKNEIMKIVNGTFEEQLLEGSFTSLSQVGNPLRYNNFACNIRELSRHVLKRMAPDEDIKKCFWYEQNEEDKITRKQRVEYAIAKGFDISYLEEKCGVDIYETTREIIKEIDRLNKYTHVNPESINLSEDEVWRKVEEISGALSQIFYDIEKAKESLVEKIEGILDASLEEEILALYINELDIKSTHHWGEYILLDDIKIEEMDFENVYIQVSGGINIRHQIGSDGDMRRGDGMEWEKCYQFDGRVICPIDTFPKKISVDENFFDLETNEPED